MDQELIALNQKLLDSISNHDWETYASLVAEDLTCYEPQANGQLVEGLPFHKFYFDHPSGDAIQSTMCAVKVIPMGPDHAAVLFSRLMQVSHMDGGESNLQFEETRLWRRTPEGWKHFHLHRSANGAG